MKNPKIIFVHGNASTGSSLLIRDILWSIYRDNPRGFFDMTMFATKYSINKAKYSKYETVVIDQQPDGRRVYDDYFERFLTLGNRSLVVLTAFGSMRDDLLSQLSDAEYQDFIDNHDILDIETFREKQRNSSYRYIRSFSLNGSSRQFFDGTYDARFISGSNKGQPYRVEIQNKLDKLLNLKRYRK